MEKNSRDELTSTGLGIVVVAGVLGIVALLCFRIFGFIPVIIAGCVVLIGVVLVIVAHFARED